MIRKRLSPSDENNILNKPLAKHNKRTYMAVLMPQGHYEIVIRGYSGALPICCRGRFRRYEDCKMAVDRYLADYGNKGSKEYKFKKSQ